MFASSHPQFWKLALAGALSVLTTVGAPSHAYARPENLGPVVPYEPIFTTVGNKNIIAFYEPAGGGCSIYVVVSDRSDVSGASAAQFRVSLSARQIVRIDSTQEGSLKTLNLGCGDNAEKLAILNSDSPVASDTTIQPPGQPLKANASGF